MRAVVRIAGTQVALHEEDVVRVPRLDQEEGAKLHLTDVLLVTGDNGTWVGRPTVGGAAVDAVVVRHLRGPKIEVATFKRRKDYRRHIGHRTEMTEIRVTGITGGADSPGGGSDVRARSDAPPARAEASPRPSAKKAVKKAAKKEGR